LGRAPAILFWRRPALRTKRIVIVGVIWALVIAVGGGTAHAEPQWAPAESATVHPGVQVRSESGQCTANFVFFDATDVYLGQAAHCTGTGAATDVNGCEEGVLPLGTPVLIDGASQPGTVVYNSWIAMQAAEERNESLCMGNDFALVRLHPNDRALVNPSIPFWGGPNGLDGSSAFGETVYGYGNSELRLGITALSPKVGLATGQSNEGSTHNVWTITPGIPGDSGSAYLGSGGGALGVLSLLSLPTGSNLVSDLSRALDYMRANTDLDAVQLANGTEAFSPLF
jgi:hypothetical protein